MSGAIDRFSDAARAQGLHPEVRRFPEGTKTAADAARAIGCDVAQIVKSLVFMAGEAPVLALTSGANRVDTEALAGLAGRTRPPRDAGGGAHRDRVRRGWHAPVRPSRTRA